QVEAEPNSPDLRVRYGNILRFLDDRDEAIAQYRTALRLDPANLEAFLNLGRLARDAGNRVEARRMLENVVAQAPHSDLPRGDGDASGEAAGEDRLGLAVRSERSGGGRLPMLPGPLKAAAARRPGMALPRPAAPVARKVGRNDPCPCGSGKKY